MMDKDTDHVTLPILVHRYDMIEYKRCIIISNTLIVSDWMSYEMQETNPLCNAYECQKLTQHSHQECHSIVAIPL